MKYRPVTFVAITFFLTTMQNKTEKTRVGITTTMRDREGVRRTVRVMLSYIGTDTSRALKSLVAMLMLMMVTLPIHAQLIDTDPALAAAIAAQTSTVKSELDKQNETQLAILGIDTGISLTLDSIHHYEQIVYDYLSKAQTVVEGATDIARCLELSTEVLAGLGDLTKEARDHPQGVLVSALASKVYSRLMTDAVELAGYVQTVVTGKGSGNLLNTFERIRILSDIKYTLMGMVRDINSLTCEIGWMRISDIPRLLFPSEYYQMIGIEDILKDSKKDIDSLFN